MNTALIDLCYLISAVMFIIGLKGMTRPRTAVRGNLIGSAAMLLAVIATLMHYQVVSYAGLIVGMLIGSVIGVILALRVEMTAMPQLVALFNGLGGGASVLVAGAWLAGKEFAGDLAANNSVADALTATGASGLIGAVTLSGSLVAFAKLQELKFIRDFNAPWQKPANLFLAGACILLCALMVLQPAHAQAYFWIMSLLALAMGVLLVVSIGGADMPVVIALLNSYSGIAASATGFVLQNNLLIIAGSLVGASGILLTRIMCTAMNRSLAAVLFGTLQAKTKSKSDDDIYANVKSSSAEEVAMMLEVAQKVLIIPGYGMAVAQAQHAVRDLTNLLTARDIDVEFGIHPVAGRMPGHMNVLLAEADIAYERLKEMDEVNSTMDQVDVAIVLGANDVVNPLARTDPDSPIAGMPVIDADRARTVVVVKRSLSPGFAGIANPLFAMDNSLMLFADGKQAIVDIVKALQEG
ncbi:MAG: NAD(P)(+) transhydrogenase (Re/Si-specific) subunit beta [Planctomycetaceae bacterium]|nr:NAD(P)(+) transhydrogenase (Re/Si-specific) subunit beta [Planctomycetaceae bacterium]